MTTRHSRVCRAHLFFLAVMVCTAHPTVLTCRAATAGESKADPNWFALQPVKDEFRPFGARLQPVGRGADRQAWVRHGQGRPVRLRGWDAGPVLGRADEHVLPRGSSTTRSGACAGRGSTSRGCTGWILPAAAGRTSFDYNPESFDRLDNLLAKLGENGIYMILDLHYPLTYRFKPGDNIPGLPQGGPASHAQFFNEKVAAIMHQRMVDFFTPPQSLHEEALLRRPHARDGRDPQRGFALLGRDAEPFRAELEAKFAAWLRKKYGDDGGPAKGLGAGGKSPLAEGEGLGSGQRIRLIRNSQFTEKYFQDRPEQKDPRAGPDAVLPGAGRQVLGRQPRRAAQGRRAGPDQRHELAGPRFPHAGPHARPVQAGLHRPPRLLGSPPGRGQPEVEHQHRAVPQPADGQGRQARSGYARLPWRGQPGHRKGVGTGARPAHDRQRMEHLRAERVFARRDRPDGRLRPAPGLGRPAGVRLLQPGLARAVWARARSTCSAIRRRSCSSRPSPPCGTGRTSTRPTSWPSRSTTPRASSAWTEDRKPVPIAAALVGKVGYRFVPATPRAGSQRHPPSTGIRRS